MPPLTTNNNNDIPTVSPQQQTNIDAFNQGLKNQGVNSQFVSGQGVINSDLLKSNPKQIKITDPAPANTASAIIGASGASLQQSKDSLAKQQELDVAKAKDQYQLSNDRYASVVSEIMGVQDSRTNLEATANIPKLNQEVVAITNEIDTTQRAYQNELKALDSAGLTDAGKASASRDIQRKYASQLADLAVIEGVKTRNLSNAQANIDRKIQLQLEPLKIKAEYLKTIYEDNKDNLTKSQDKAFQLKIKEDDRTYKKEEDRIKTLEDTRLKYMDIASSLGKDTSVLKAFQGATTPEEIMSIASKNGVVSLEDQLKTVQIQEKKADIEKTRAEASLIVGNSGVKADSLNAYANQYSDTGKLPSPAELKQSGLSVGQVTLLAKQAKKPDGALVSTNTGVKSSSLSPAQEDGIVAMSEIVRQTLPSLQEKFPKLYTGLIGGLAGQVFTTQDRQDYLTFRQEFLNKLLKARSGATVTPQEYDRYSNLLPGEFNQSLFFGSDGSKKLNSLATAMKQTLDNSLKSNQLSIYGYSTVPVGGIDRKVGEILDMNGVKLRVLPDGTLTDNI
jgi:hypothetical protein